MGTMFAQAFATITMFFSALHKLMSAADKYAGIVDTTAQIQVELTTLEQSIKREANKRALAKAIKDGSIPLEMQEQPA